MRGTRRTSAVLAGAALALALAVPGAAQAVNPPTCHSLGYDYPFFRIDGSTFARNVRWLELRQAKTPHPADPVNHPGDQYPNKYDSDPEYPFQLRVDRTQHASRTFTVHDYARDQFKVSFNQGERATATATYVEDHSGYSPTGGTLHVRCTRTISAKFKKPPRQRQPGGGGGGDDPED